MAGVTQTIDLDLETLRAGFQRLRENAEDLRPILDEIGLEMVQSTERRFDDSVEPSGRRWTPSAAARKEGRKTLVKTQNLARGFGYEADETGVTWGTNVRYAAIHQFGFDDLVVVSSHDQVIRRAKGKKLKAAQARHVPQHTRRMFMPPRPFIGISEGDVGAMADIVAAALQRGVP